MYPTKITGLKSLTVNAEMRNWVFVKVQTDQPGLYGWGEATLEWKTRAVTGAVEDLAPLLLGRDPRDIEQMVRRMHKQGFWRLGVIGASAIQGSRWRSGTSSARSSACRCGGCSAARPANRRRLHPSRHGRHAAVYETMQRRTARERALEWSKRAKGAQGRLHALYPLPRHGPRRGPCRAPDGGAPRGGRRDGVEIMVDFHGRPASAVAALDYIQALAPPADVRRGAGAAGRSRR